MTRGILIAGNESSLFRAIAAEAAKRVESYASACIPNRLSLRAGTLQGATDEPGGAIPLSWNPSSHISARTLIIAAENRLRQINDAILVCSPPSIFRTAETLTVEEIETLVDDQIKGWFFLIRELMLYLRRQGPGAISFVASEIKNSQTDILGPAAAASFINFSQSILASSLDEPFQMMGFSGSDTGGNREFAEWLFKQIDESPKKKSGRWNKFSKLPFIR
jgi:hypothetical protein